MMDTFKNNEQLFGNATDRRLNNVGISVQQIQFRFSLDLALNKSDTRTGDIYNKSNLVL